MAELQAVTGVKAIVLPEEELKQGLQGFYKERDKKAPASQLIKELHKLSTQKDVPDYFVEEYDHFYCLALSATGSLFHIRNILLRQCFSAVNRTRVQAAELEPHPIYDDVVRYYLDYALFHYLAYPFLEAHALFALGRRTWDTTRSYMYPERVRACFEILRPVFTKIPSMTDHKMIATWVDRNYVQSKKSKALPPYAVEFDLNKKRPRDAWPRLIWSELTPFVFRPVLWVRTAKLVLNNLSRVWPYLVGRLFPSAVKESPNTGQVPALFSTDITIDPVGIDTEALALPSPEVDFIKPEDKLCSDLLWHVLSRHAIVYALRKRNFSVPYLHGYFEELCLFNERWRPMTKAANIKYVTPLDMDIIKKTEDHEYRKRSLFSRTLVHDLSSLAIDTYNESRKRFLKPVGKENEALADALNCTYMHI